MGDTQVVPGIYRHFKGGIYRVIGVAYHSDDGKKEHVIYKALYGDEDLWIRPLEEFVANVDRLDYEGPRFILIREIKMGEFPFRDLDFSGFPIFSERRDVAQWFCNVKDGIGTDDDWLLRMDVTEYPTIRYDARFRDVIVGKCIVGEGKILEATTSEAALSVIQNMFPDQERSGG